MSNWRKNCIKLLLFASSSNIEKNLEYIKSMENKTKQELSDIQDEKLKTILLYAYNNCPYYSNLLHNHDDVIVGDDVNLNNFNKIPILTKDIIRNNYKQILSNDSKLFRKKYTNTSGGSTGEPIIITQDNFYNDWNIANKIYYKYVGGQDLGERELRLWGSERDILEGREKFSTRIRNWIYNRYDFNAFRITEKDFAKLLEKWNRYKPTWVESYIQSIFEFAKYIKKNNAQIFSPKGILTSAGVLSSEVREYLEYVFKCKIYNRYGSREVGDIACNCNKNNNLHLSIWNHYVEVLDENMKPIFNKPGKIYVTTLNNFSMPLIRYDIGDVGILENDFKICACKKITRSLTNIQGRTVNFFKSENGELIDGEYFTHLFYFRSWIKKFQIVQKNINQIECNIVLQGEKNQKDIIEMEKNIKKIMSEKCNIRWRFVTDIQDSSSGKFLYTRCDI